MIIDLEWPVAITTIVATHFASRINIDSFWHASRVFSRIHHLPQQRLTGHSVRSGQQRAIRGQGHALHSDTRSSTMAPPLTYWQIWRSTRLPVETCAQTRACIHFTYTDTACASAHTYTRLYRRPLSASTRLIVFGRPSLLIMVTLSVFSLFPLPWMPPLLARWLWSSSAATCFPDGTLPISSLRLLLRNPRAPSP